MESSTWLAWPPILVTTYPLGVSQVLPWPCIPYACTVSTSLFHCVLMATQLLSVLSNNTQHTMKWFDAKHVLSNYTRSPFVPVDVQGGYKTHLLKLMFLPQNFQLRAHDHLKQVRHQHLT